MKTVCKAQWTGAWLGSLLLITSHSPLRADHATPPAGSPPDSAAVHAPKAVDQIQALIREASLALLKEGNGRFVAGQPRHPNQDASRRSLTVSEGQKPFATILACSDSRSPVETLFDRGVGELFVVRVAGNVADETQVATIEYGVEHLGTPLLVVLGHSGCGAVSAACKGGELHGHLPALISRIQPAVAKARAAAATPDRVIPTAIQANVWQQIEEIYFQSSIVREKVREGALQIVGGVYDLEKGTVNWLGAHPNQEALLSQADAAERESALSAALKARAESPARSAGGADGGTDAHGHGDASQTPAQGTQHEPDLLRSLLPIREVKARSPQPEHPAEEHQPEHPSPGPHH
ncbi:MAG: carbonic anhydrase [Verrucomicrobia bacterium]|nr:carbonic anhydrase [Verrucomicrobiota bacterium]MBI3868211.1 carbonic anhydrase [Verrucomicrobiota bacterium]